MYSHHLFQKKAVIKSANILPFIRGFNITSQLVKNKNLEIMKNALYVIATLILIIWGLIYFGFHAGAGIHILLIVAGIIVLVRIAFSKQLNRS